MRRIVSVHALLFLSVWLGLTSTSSGQITDPEAEYIRIREIAFSGCLPEAEKSLHFLLDSFPAFDDAKILLARVCAWQKKYIEGIVYIDEVLSVTPQNIDALEAKSDILRWIAAEEQQAREAEEARVEALRLEEEERLAEIEKREIARIDSLNRSSRSEVLAGYEFDAFREPYSRFWQTGRLGASYLTPQGKALAFVNIGHLTTSSVKETEFQFEAEGYPVISDKMYGWLNYAWSPGNYFPGHRLSAELWRKVGEGWVVSGGGSYYYFDRSIFIAVLSAEKYLGPWWLNGRTYFYFKDAGITTSLFLNVRYYFNDFDYLQVTAGTGTAPDEPFDVVADIERLGATTFRLTYNRNVSGRVTLRAGLGFSREEYEESVLRNRLDGALTIGYKLRTAK